MNRTIEDLLKFAELWDMFTESEQSHLNYVFMGDELLGPADSKELAHLDEALSGWLSEAERGELRDAYDKALDAEWSVAREDVESSNLAWVAWHNSTLRVGFKSGAVYQYEDVPQLTYAALMDAPSHGKYFNANIRNNYACSNVDIDYSRTERRGP